MKLVRKRLTYANVMSTIAVFLVVAGGSALAANQLGKNTVGAKQLKKEAVTSAKVKNGAISGGKLANGAVNGSKLAAGAVGASNLAPASVGASSLAPASVGSGAIADSAVTGSKLAPGAVGAGNIVPGSITPSQLSAAAQPTPVASVDVKADGTVVSSTPGVTVVLVGTHFCVGLPFAASGGAVSTTGAAVPKSNAQVSIPNDGNCSGHPGAESAVVYTSNDGTLTADAWTGVFR
jgi:hypothetical protein